MQSHIGCICLAFLHCVSSDGPWKNAPLNTCYHLFCNCNSLNHICSEQRLRALIRCAFSEFACTVFQTCIPDQNKWKVFLNAYEGCVLSMPSFFVCSIWWAIFALVNNSIMYTFNVKLKVITSGSWIVAFVTRKHRMRFQFCTILCVKFTTSPLQSSSVWLQYNVFLPGL